MTDKTQREAIEKAAKIERDQYIFINDFKSALRLRPDTANAIYTNDIIHGWIEDTYELAFKKGAEFGISFERERAKVLVDALDWYQEKVRWCHAVAEDALAKYRGET